MNRSSFLIYVQQDQQDLHTKEKQRNITLSKVVQMLPGLFCFFRFAKKLLQSVRTVKRIGATAVLSGCSWMAVRRLRRKESKISTERTNRTRTCSKSRNAGKSRAALAAPGHSESGSESAATMTPSRGLLKEWVLARVPRSVVDAGPRPYYTRV